MAVLSGAGPDRGAGEEHDALLERLVMYRPAAEISRQRRIGERSGS